MYRSIMVPLDGSPFSEQALPFARTIAHESAAHLDLVYVHTLAIPTYAVNAVPLYDEAEEARRLAEERAYLEGLARRLQDETEHGATVTLLDEPVAPALIDHATKTHTDLVVMTTHGRGALSRLWLGSVADTLVHQLPNPLLLIRPKETLADAPRDPAFTHVLIPLDGSALAEDILDHALALGTLTHAHYTLVQAVEPIMITYCVPPAVVRVDEQQVRQARINAQSYLDRVAERLRARGLTVDTAIVMGPPALAILEYAQQHAVDVIAMSTHGRSGFKRMLLGSVADKVVRGACVPVLLHRSGGGGGGHEVAVESERHEAMRART